MIHRKILVMTESTSWWYACIILRTALDHFTSTTELNVVPWLRIGLSLRSTPYPATDPGSRPSAAQPRTELSVTTRPGSRTMEAARGNGYAPVRGLPVMMMIMKSAVVYWTHQSTGAFKRNQTVQSVG